MFEKFGWDLYDKSKIEVFGQKQGGQHRGGTAIKITVIQKFDLLILFS